MYCVLCREEFCLISNFCNDCKRVQRMVVLYGKDKVKDILENVLVRNEDQQERKVNFELKKEEDQLKEKIKTRSSKKDEK